MLNIKKILKGLRILNSIDQSKAVELTISDAATTNTKTILSAQQTANRTIVLPDASTTLVGVDNTQNFFNCFYKICIGDWLIEHPDIGKRK